MRYVKVCPRCGAENDEMAEICLRDGEFLGMVPATAAVAAPVAAVPAVAVESAVAEEPAPVQGGDPVLYLENGATGECHLLRPGWVVGQEHPDSTAEVQLGERPGIQYVHRRHCRVVYDDGLWEVEALQQQDYTNPTLVNRRRVPAGGRMALRNGDTLALSGVQFTVRVVTS